MESSIIIDEELYIIDESLLEADTSKLSSSQYYYNEVRYYPVLTKDEEQALFIKWRIHKDETAKERLIKCNLRYVVKKAYGYACHNKDSFLKVEDFIQEGNIGLLVALERFDYTKGYRLLTYADMYISNYMRKAMHNQEKTIRLPVRVEEDYSKIRKAYVFLLKYSKENITTEKLAKTSGLPIKKVESTLNHVKKVVYFDTPIKNNSSKQEGKDKTLGETLIDSTCNDLMEIIIEQSMQSEKMQFLNKLSYEEKNLILKKYNPHGKIVTDEELALITNTTTEKVQQNLQRAKRKLRQNQKKPLYN